MRAFALFFATLIGFFCAHAFAQQEKTAFSDLVVLAPKLARLQNQFEQMTTPGVSIEAREVFRKGASGVDLQVRYNIYVKGVPPDSVFHQLQWPVDREKPVSGFSGITINSDGLMICAGRTAEQCHSGDRLDAPIQFSRIKPLKGEPMRFIFISKDLKVPVSFIPDPVESEDNGCKLSAVRLSAKFELALIEGMGFPPNAEVRLKNSNGESPEAVVILDDNGVSATADKSTGVVVKTDARGAIQATLLNNTTGSTTGSEVVQMIAPHCSPKVQYSWGVF